MTEKILGIIGVMTWGWGTHQTLFFTENRVIVARGKQYHRLGLLGIVGGVVSNHLLAKEEKKLQKMVSSDISVESILKADEENFAIENSEVVEVELKKLSLGRGVKVAIKTRQKEYKWVALGILGKELGESTKFEEYIPILQKCVAPDKLVVSK